MKKYIYLGIAVIVATSSFFVVKNLTTESPVGGQVGVSPIQHQIVTLSSVSFYNFGVTLASQSLTLVEDPGDSCVLELVSVTGMRVFASEAWKNVNEGFEVKYENRTGLNAIASFSKGFSSGGADNSVASPSWVVRFGADTMASPSEPLILTASTSQTIDGDTTFKFDTAYRKICK